VDRVARIERVQASAYRIPTDAPESDGTLEWDATTIVIAEAAGGGQTGLGYSYADSAAVSFIRTLSRAIVGFDAMDIPACWTALTVALRNSGRPGIASAALSAIDASLWDLKGKLTKLPVVSLLGGARDGVPAYGSGGFTSYSVERLQQQLGGWVANGLTRVKMKIGRCARDDVTRVKAARQVARGVPGGRADGEGAHRLPVPILSLAWNVLPTREKSGQ